MSTETKDSLRVIFFLDGDPRKDSRGIAVHLLKAYAKMRPDGVPHGEAIRNKALCLAANLKVDGRMGTADIGYVGVRELSNLGVFEKLSPKAKRIIRNAASKARAPGMTAFIAAIFLSGDMRGNTVACGSWETNPEGASA